MTKKKRNSLKDSTELHKTFENLVRRGQTLDEISKELGLTYSQAWSIKDDLGLTVKKKGQDVVYQVIARLMNTECTYQSIGNEVGRTRARIEQIAAKMREFGIPLHASREHRIMADRARPEQELQKTSYG